MCPVPKRRGFLKGVTASVGMLLLSQLADAQSSGEDAKKDSKDRKKTATAEEIYVPGGDVKAPKLVHYVEPQFSSSAQEAYVEGVVKISTVVNPDGVPTDLHVVSGLNAKEDETAVEALKQWRFQPGTKDKKAVNVRVTVQIEFHLL